MLHLYYNTGYFFVCLAENEEIARNIYNEVTDSYGFLFQHYTYDGFYQQAFAIANKKRGYWLSKGDKYILENPFVPYLTRSEKINLLLE